MSEQKIFHCTGCGYTGHETGWRVGYLLYACPTECKTDSGAYIALLEYDPVDDAIPNASESEHAAALAAVHKFQRKSRPVVLDLTTPEKFENFKAHFETARRAKPDTILNLAEIVQGFNKQTSAG